ncbi:MAG TPA: hypothetical protein VFH82_05750, partial [Gemmatimonadota bacterium]|nr:hypothetical protein [Gemmatimonadota bacterium]
MSRRVVAGRHFPSVLLVAGVLLALALGACAPATPRTTFPPLGQTPGPAGDDTAATRKVIVDALSGAGIQAVDAQRTYRPAEGALLAAAPRSLLQVTLPADPTHGYILVYSLGSEAAATAAANDQASYLASSVAKAYYPPGTSFVLRVIGNNVVFFSWLPPDSPDPQTPEVQRVLESLG